MRDRVFKSSTVLLTVSGAALWIVVSVFRGFYLGAVVGAAVFFFCYYDLPALVPRKAGIHTVLLGFVLLTIAISLAGMKDADVLEGWNLVWVIVSQVAVVFVFPIIYDLKHPGAIRDIIFRKRSR